MPDFTQFKLSVVPSPPDDRDYHVSSLAIMLEEFPDEVRVQYNHPIKNQGQVGSCVPHSLAYVKEVKKEIENCIMRQSEEVKLKLLQMTFYEKMQYIYSHSLLRPEDYVEFSVGFPYADRDSGDFQGSGMIPRQALSHLSKEGNCFYQDFPINEEYPGILNDFNKVKEVIMPKAIPNRIEAYGRAYTSNDIQSAFMQHGPVTVAFKICQEFYSITRQNPVLKAYQPNEALLGGHEQTIFGWTKRFGEPCFIIPNSWGPEWGEDGYYYVPFRLIDDPKGTLLMEAWSVTDTIAGNGIDCASVLTAQTADSLKSVGVTSVGRYLGAKNWGWSKCITPDELKVIHSAGLSIFLIWEYNPTYSGYFNYGKGLSDGKLAVEEAQYLGAPSDKAIFFTVDFDAQPGDMAAIIEYFRGVKDGVAGQYKIGAYGSYDVLSILKSSANPPDKYYQTYAWSGGQVLTDYNIYQFQNDVTLKGVDVDIDMIRENSGAWSKEDNSMKVAVVYFTSADYSEALIYANRNGGCAMFCRNGQPGVHADAMNAQHVINIGGPKLGHSNETYLSGADAEKTLIEVAKNLQGK